MTDDQPVEQEKDTIRLNRSDRSQINAFIGTVIAQIAFQQLKL